MTQFYSDDEFDKFVTELEQQGYSTNQALAEVRAQELQDQREFHEFREEQDRLAQLEEDYFERMMFNIGDEWYENQYDLDNMEHA
jgi:hypothetical protein